MDRSEISRSDVGEAGAGAPFGRTLRGALAATVAFLAVTGAASAATLIVDPPPPSTGAVGTVWKVQVTVDRSAGEPSRVPAITIVNETTGARRSIVTTPTGKRDAYRATVDFGSRGEWSYELAYGTARTKFAGAISIGGKASGGSSSGWKLLALVAAAFALVALTALAGLLVRRPRRAPVLPPPVEPSPDLVHDRRSLISSLLYLYDIVGDDVIRARLRDALAEAGVSELDSVGARFDPAKHRATGRVPTDDPALDGRIAEVERRGFSDRGAVLRLPEVRIYSVNSGRGR